MALLSRRPNENRRRGTPADFLVIGLGNPGAEFDHTRHNVGADCAAELASRHGSPLKKGKERSLVSEVMIDGTRVAIGFPQTYMNKSGEAVRMLARRYGVEDADKLIVVHDELDLDVGRLKLKQGGGLAGHNGLRSITQHVGTTDFIRLRIGVGKPPPSQAGRDWVLRRPGKADAEALEKALDRAIAGIEQLFVEGIDAAMNTLNRKPE